MNPPSADASHTSSPARKKRRLRYPRAARACTFCRKRKVRCSGTLPCEYCVREDVPHTCEYGQGVPPPNRLQTTDQERAHNSSATAPAAASTAAEHQSANDSEWGSRFGSPEEGNCYGMSERDSFEPPQMFTQDQHVGPTAGISFLYHPWNKAEGHSRTTQEGLGVSAATCKVPLDSYGDFPLAVLEISQNPILPHLAPDRMPVTLERYFRFATPTYRYLHRPTVEAWAALYVKDDPRLRDPQRACVLLACAQSLLYAIKSECYVTEDCNEMKESRVCFQQAKDLLDRETGPPSLASVQARLSMCLYMLSTFRMTACRFCFSLTVTILISLGLHRVQSTSSQSTVDPVESESRRRAFWCAYVLDGYLSVMLGRPRSLRDEDIDQAYPGNVDDHDLTSGESIEELPQHGNLEAFLAHAGLAKLMARNNDLLYPLQPLTEEQLLHRSSELLDALESWRQSLPNFLKPGNKTLSGERMFERQNTVLKLAHSHLRILMTRRCLLSNTNGSRPLASGQIQDSRSMRLVQECVAGITTVLDTTVTLIERGLLYHCFWFTQYIALVAISTLYVFLLQSARQAPPSSMSGLVNVEKYFGMAKKCQRRLNSLAPPESQAKRHHRLLDHLRGRVERDLLTSRKATVSANPVAVGNLEAQSGIGVQFAPSQHQGMGHVESAQLRDTGSETAVPFTFRQDPTPYLSQIDHPHSTIPREHHDDSLALISPLNSASDSDQNITNMLDLGWTNLDTIGFMMPYTE